MATETQPAASSSNWDTKNNASNPTPNTAPDTGQNDRSYWKTHFLLGRSSHGYGRVALEHVRFVSKQLPVPEGVHERPVDPAGFKKLHDFVHDYGTGFESLVDVLQHLANIRRELDMRVDNCLATWLNSVEQMNVIKGKRDQFDELEKKYQSDLKKFLSLKPTTEESSVLAETAKDLSMQRQFLALQRFDVESSLREFHLRRTLNTLQPLAEILEAYADFSRASFETLEQKYANDIGALREYVTSGTEDVDTQIHERRQMRRQMEKELFAFNARSSQIYGGAGGVSMVPQGKGIRDLDAAIHSADNAGKLVKQGTLYLPSTSASGFTPVWCELKQDGVLSVRPLPTRLRAQDLDISRPIAAEQHSQRGHAFSTQTFNLMLCTVKEERDLNLRLVFSVISPLNSITLQAETYENMRDWMDTIQNAIATQINALRPATSAASSSSASLSSPSPPSSPLASPSSSQNSLLASNDDLKSVDETALAGRPSESPALRQLRTVPSNAVCADCGASDPDWVSINLGVLICLECSAFHRSLGTHISKVRSLTLDKIDDFLLAYLAQVGNANSNAIWEALLSHDANPPPDRVQERQAFIRAKYKETRWLKRSNEEQSMGKEQLSRLLFDATVTGDVTNMLRLIFLGADVNWQSPEQDYRTPLLQSVYFNNTTTTELLLQNGAQVAAVEARQWHCLHYAAYYDYVHIAEQILARGGRYLVAVADDKGQTPLSLVQELESTKSNILPLLQQAKERLDRDNQQPRPIPGASKHVGGGGAAVVTVKAPPSSSINSNPMPPPEAAKKPPAGFGQKFKYLISKVKEATSPRSNLNNTDS